MLPHPLLMILLPIGLLQIRGARGVLYATLPLCLIAYALYTFSVPHYVVIAAPAAGWAWSWESKRSPPLFRGSPLSRARFSGSRSSRS